MNEMNIKLHALQLEIVRKLVKVKGLRFNDLPIENLGSEHMNYHLKKLIDLEFVQKLNGKYELTDQGKHYSNLLDDNVEIVERQPKCSVTIKAVRKNPKTKEIEQLLSKRLRQPYLGKMGSLTGKVRFGETFEQAAARELYEETGLKAKSFVLETVYHKLRHKKDGNFVQDNIFFIFLVTDLYGDLIEKTNFQENRWVGEAELRSGKLDLFDDFVIVKNLKPKPLSFYENISQASGY